MARALNLSGGGAKGAFQAGAIHSLYGQGYDFDLVHGVSVGALNAAMVATGQIDTLARVWHRIDESSVHKRHSLAKLAGRYGLHWLGISDPPISLYDNSPLRKLVREHLLGKKITIPLYVGTVNIVTGHYANQRIEGRITETDVKRIVGSTAIPILYEPVKVESVQYVDGGVRNVAPISNLLPHDPDELVIILCSPYDSQPVSGAPRSLHGIAKRTFDLILEDVFQSDINTFLRINHMVRQAKKEGIALESPSGKPYRQYNYTIIQPDIDLGGTLNFTPKRMRRWFTMGQESARPPIELEEELNERLETPVY